MVQHADQAPHQRFVVRREFDRPPSPVRSSREIATRLALLDQSLRGSRCRFPEARAFALEPALELGPIRDEEPLQQRRSEEHTSELQSRLHLVCRLLLEKKKKT